MSVFPQGAMLSTIKSPNVVQYFGFGKSSQRNVYWFIMELLNGQALDTILADSGPLSEIEGIKV